MAAPRPGQHRDVADARQRGVHSRPRQPPALHRQLGPAQAGGVFGAQQQIGPTAPRVEVHQQGARETVRQRGRENGRAGTAASRDHCHRDATVGVSGGQAGVGDGPHQHLCLLGQEQNALRPNGNRHLQSGCIRLGETADEHRRATWQPGAGAARGGLSVEHHRCSRRPHRAHRRPRGIQMGGPHTGGGSGPLDVVAQRGVGQEGQECSGVGHRSTVAGRRGRPPVTKCDLWMNCQLGTTAEFRSQRNRAATRDRRAPLAKHWSRQKTTLARGGGGEGRRVSAPGGRADAHPAQAE